MLVGFLKTWTQNWDHMVIMTDAARNFNTQHAIRWQRKCFWSRTHKLSPCTLCQWLMVLTNPSATRKLNYLGASILQRTLRRHCGRAMLSRGCGGCAATAGTLVRLRGHATSYMRHACARGGWCRAAESLECCQPSRDYG